MQSKKDGVIRSFGAASEIEESRIISRAARSLGDGEVIVPLPADRARIPLTTLVRSTMILSSIDALRERNLHSAYHDNLSPQHRDELRSVVAGAWLPMELGIAHYEACDRLPLSQAELIEIGGLAFRQSKATALHLAAALAKTAGATPWTILAQGRRLWERIFAGGGAISVVKLGPKEARVELVSWPLARIRYNRIAVRGIIHAMIELVCSRAYVSEIPGLCSAASLGYRLAWA